MSTFKYILFVTLALLILCNSDLSGQKFKAAAILGANACQIDGDSLYGFNKIGMSVGGRLSYANEKAWDIAIEMLYSQRGSTDGLIRKESAKGIKLNYFEIPILFSLRDWYNETDKYYKVRAEGGLSYGYLFQADALGFNVDKLKTHDFSWIIGAGINFNKMIGMSLRYTSSMINLNHNIPEKNKYISYFITLRGEINF